MAENPIYIRRKIDTKIQEYLKWPEILAIVGPRQSGKTTYLEHLISEKRGKFVSFEDVNTLNLFNNDIKKFINTYLSDTDLLCIDEFQYAKAGGKNLKYIFDTYKGKKIVISGSSAIDITIHALKYLVGRVIVINFWPFDKDELRTVFPHFTEKELYDYYATYGGYPRVAIASNNEERKLMLKGIYNTYFFDIGFLNHILSYEVPSGKKLEQVALMELIKAGFHVKYWRDKQDREMDFVVYKDNKIITAIESKIGGEYTESFNAFKKAYPNIEAQIVTEDNVFETVDSLKSIK